jgi:hypothetical protein
MTEDWQLPFKVEEEPDIIEEPAVQEPIKPEELLVPEELQTPEPVEPTPTEPLANGNSGDVTTS